jgi:hypothetical protein
MVVKEVAGVVIPKELFVSVTPELTLVIEERMSVTVTFEELAFA